jgi:cell division protein FtsA
LLNDAGFDDDPMPVFSGIASAYGVLTEDEKETGTLLLDIGAGTCEYLAMFNMGILASGVLPIGFEHLANDLSLGLDLHISDCRKLLQDGTIVQHINERKTFIEIKSTLGNIRKIPLASFETIIDLRLRETFQIIHHKLAAQNALHNLNSGGVLTGGGALFPPITVLFSEIFNFPVRVGKPFSTNGTTGTTGIESPQYATIWGSLKFAEELNQIINFRQENNIIREILDIADNVASNFLRSLSKIFKSVKF